MGSQGVTERRDTHQAARWSSSQELPGDQDWVRGGRPRTSLLLREDLSPPSQWNQCQRVRRSVCGDYQEDQTSHLQHVTLTPRTLRFSVTTTSSSKRRRGRWRGPGRGRTSVDSPLSSLTSSLRTSANISLLRST